MAILQSGIFVALPTIAFSIFCDSMYYGKWTCPQFMFVYVNVIEDITAFFGVCNMDFFLYNFEHFIVAFASLHDTFVFFFCVFAMYQVHGKLPYQKRNQAS